MGVKGLQSFLKQNEEKLAIKTEISDCSLVIDANNLLCQLYSGSCCDKSSPHFRNDIYGGDLVYYGELVKEFFTNLAKCNIRAVLVFDGSVIGKHALKDYVASKEQETYRRGLDRFNRAKSFDEFATDEDILLPQTINIVFRNIVSEFGVQRIQTPYEADTHIARIANDLDCPVLTNDSDFLIYKLKKGFIMLDQMDYKNLKTSRLGKNFINCSMYTQDKLARTMRGFDTNNLPLLSVLLGNDYVEPGTFDRIMATLNVNGPYDGIFSAKSFSHRRIANLLDWLSRQDLRRSIGFILDLVHQNNRDKLSKVMNLLLRSYNIESTDDFDAELEAIYPSSKALVQKKEENIEQDSDLSALTPVAFLRRRMENDDLGSIALDMIFRNTHYNYSILDDFALPSSSYVKFRPYSLALSLLRSNSYENLTVYRRKIQSERDAFLIYDRVRGEYTKLSVKPMMVLENFGSLDCITCYSMITLEPTLKKKMLMSCFHFNPDELSLMSDTLSQVVTEDYIAQASLCFILVKYIGLETKLPPKPQFVNALMLTIFYYAALNGNLNKSTITDSATYAQLLHELSEKTVVKCPTDDLASNSRALFRRIVHFISQLNAAYKAYCIVNSLLDHACYPPKQEKFFNGVLIFRLTRWLRLERGTVESLCPDLPILVDICQSIQTQVHCS